MAFIRWFLGRIILLVDFLYRPKGVQRSAADQAALNQLMAGLALYQYPACPFCVKVRWAMKRHSLEIETRNVKQHSEYADELMAGGGALKVPCLRITLDDDSVIWMYESSDIIDYLEQRFNLV